MLFHKHIPPPPLCNYVDCIVYVEGNNKGTGFPKTAMSLAFNLNDPFKLFSDDSFSRFSDYRKYWVAGLQTQPSYVESYGLSKMLVIQFKTLGAYLFLNQPLREFTNQYIELDCVFKATAEDTWEQLQEAVSVNEKILIAENFLYRRLLANRLPHENLLASIDTAIRNNRAITVKEICAVHQISRKHLNFLFLEYLGVSPKMLLSLNRFQAILQTISRSRPEKLTDVAYELDFFDQAHFNNNFRKFTGLKPFDYIRNIDRMPSLKLMPHFLPAG